MRSVIFKRCGGGWEGMLDGKFVIFPGTMGDAYFGMREKHPDVRIGFRAVDVGPETAVACLLNGDGGTLWMKEMA